MLLPALPVEGMPLRKSRTTMHRYPFLFLVLLLPVVFHANPIRPLAQDYVAVGTSPDSLGKPFYTPSIIRLESGRLLAAYEIGGDQRLENKPWAVISISDDGDLTWTVSGRTRITHGRLFQSGDAIYYLGHSAKLLGSKPEDRSGDLRIIRSTDNGQTWGQAVNLTKDQMWHQSACNVWHANGHVYLVMERRVSTHIEGWFVGELAPILMRAPEGADLTRPGSWTYASELSFDSIIPGYKQNDMPLSLMGIPFYKQNYPSYTEVAPDRYFSPMGWLEANVVQIMDPNHYWYDPTGHTFHLFMRANTGRTGYAALAKVVEHPDGTMTTRLETAPTGEELLYLPFPGGQMRFHVLYDEQTRLYWLLGSQATDSMTRADRLPPDRYGTPDNERHRLVLHFSRNMVDWCFAGVVAIGPTYKQSRHYASMDIDGEDLVILSRSGNSHAKSAHDGNMITFHRVKNFRDLVY